MTSQIPFTPVTAEALARLTKAEWAAFSSAADYLARDQKPPTGTVVTLVETIQRLIGESAPAGAGADMIRAERLRQVAVKGYTPEHDAEHTDGEIAEAAAAYALHAAGYRLDPADLWPWDRAGFRPGPKPVDSLVKAGALIAAEIDRIAAEEASRD